MMSHAMTIESRKKGKGKEGFFKQENWSGRSGDDLLSHALRRSTIGAEGLNGRVRDGIGCDPLAKTTRSARPVFTI